MISARGVRLPWAGTNLNGVRRDTKIEETTGVIMSYVAFRATLSAANLFKAAVSVPWSVTSRAAVLASSASKTNVVLLAAVQRGATCT